MGARHIEIVEVGPRDGLQNERAEVSTEDKLKLIERSIAAGVRRLEIASFVNPKRVPQMADAEAVIEQAPRLDGVTYIGLVLNQRGAARAVATRIGQLGAVTVSTDTFAGKNQGQTALESVESAAAICRFARREGRRSSVTIGAAFGCPFEGEVPMDRVVDHALRLAEAEPDEIALADTVGVADPWHVAELFGRLRSALPQMPLRGHFHNTRNTGLANVHAALDAGVSTIDASIGGLGGCPFAPAATGNVATEDVLYLLERGGFATGIDLAAIIELSRDIGAIVGRELPAMVSRAGRFPPVAQAS